jgi:hypothetical protein
MSTNECMDDWSLDVSWSKDSARVDWLRFVPSSLFASKLQQAHEPPKGRSFNLALFSGSDHNHGCRPLPFDKQTSDELPVVDDATAKRAVFLTLTRRTHLFGACIRDSMVRRLHRARNI